jgi:hypothetical protein
MGSPLYDRNDLTMNTYSAGLGASFTMELAGGLYAIWNVSAVTTFYLADEEGFFMTLPGPQKYPTARSTYSPGIGGNTTLFLACRIGPWPVTVSLGGRYQYIRLTTDTFAFPNRRGQFFGAMLSAVYSLDFP